MRRSIFVLFAGWAAAGCLSGATVRTQREVGVVLARADESEAPAASRFADCAELAEAVVRSHPAVRAARSRATAALARSRAEGALPAPSAYVEVWNLPLGGGETSRRPGGNAMYMGGIVQAIPPARTRDGMARAEAEEARAALFETADVERALFREVAHACVDWSAAEVLLASIAGHRSVYAETLEAAVARYGTGGESLGQVARIEAELAVAERRLIEAEAAAEAARAALEALTRGLARLPSRAPPLREIGADPRPEPLIERSATTRGDLGAAEARSRAAQARAGAAQAGARAPSFTVRAAYMQEPGEAPGLGAMVSMSLPWLSGASGSRREAAEAMAAAAQADVDAAKRRVRADVAGAAARVVALRRALEVVVTRELTAAERAVQAERAGLAAGDFDLVAWIDAAHALERARTDIARLRSELEHALVELEASVGGPAAPPQAEGRR